MDKVRKITAFSGLTKKAERLRSESGGRWIKCAFPERKPVRGVPVEFI